MKILIFACTLAITLFSSDSWGTDHIDPINRELLKISGVRQYQCELTKSPKFENSAMKLLNPILISFLNLQSHENHNLKNQTEESSPDLLISGFHFKGSFASGVSSFEVDSTQIYSDDSGNTFLPNFKKIANDWNEISLEVVKIRHEMGLDVPSAQELGRFPSEGNVQLIEFDSGPYRTLEINLDSTEIQESIFWTPKFNGSPPRSFSGRIYFGLFNREMFGYDFVSQARSEFNPTPTMIEVDCTQKGTSQEYEYLGEVRNWIESFQNGSGELFSLALILAIQNLWDSLGHQEKGEVVASHRSLMNGLAYGVGALGFLKGGDPKKMMKVAIEVAKPVGKMIPGITGIFATAGAVGSTEILNSSCQSPNLFENLNSISAPGKLQKCLSSSQKLRTETQLLFDQLTNL